MRWDCVVRRAMLVSVGTMAISATFLVLKALDSPYSSDASAVKEYRFINDVKLPSASEGAILERHRQRRKICKQISRRAAFHMDNEFWTPFPNKYLLTVIQGHNLQCSESVALVIMVPSAPSGEKRRNQIRTTWGSPSGPDDGIIKVVFVVGRSDSTEAQEAISKEAQKYGDMLQLDFEDSYKNLTLKIILGLQWVTRTCSKAKYVAKIDDDTSWTKTEELLSYLWANAEVDSSDVFCGVKNVGTAVARENGYRLEKWRTTFQQYPDVCYPPYCDGCAGYAMSIETARTLHVTSQNTRMFWLEDIYISGILPYVNGGIPVTQIPGAGQFIENTCVLRER